MNNYKDIIDFLGINMKLIIPSIVGSLVGNINKPIKIGKKLIMIFIGTMCSIYLTPVISNLMSITDIKVNMGLSFIIGNLGLSVIEIILNKFMIKPEPSIIDEPSTTDEPSIINEQK